jgi:hypothetical protein
MGSAVFVILFTSTIFLLYDHLMNSNAVEREGVIETKRLFVRYISHEIRTPLQTVTSESVVSCSPFSVFLCPCSPVPVLTYHVSHTTYPIPRTPLHI